MEDIDGGLHPAVNGQSLDGDGDGSDLTHNYLTNLVTALPADFFSLRSGYCLPF